ncbi:MAG: hypothetical protein N2555_03170, partial [Endomicrobia bacterium]|nr:hypothetical protein [Endomicrobiia bacterium]
MSKNRLFVLVKTLFLLFISICFSQTNPVDDLVADAGVSINEIKISFTYPGPDILPEGSNYYIKYSTYLDGVIWSTTTANIVISTYNVYP